MGSVKGIDRLTCVNILVRIHDEDSCRDVLKCGDGRIGGYRGAIEVDVELK
jgi:hypothetical protein